MQARRTVTIAVALAIASVRIGPAAAQEVGFTWVGPTNFTYPATMTPTWAIFLDGDPPPNQPFTFECNVGGAYLESKVTIHNSNTGEDASVGTTASLTMITGQAFEFPDPGPYPVQYTVWLDAHGCTWVANYPEVPVRTRIPYHSVYVEHYVDQLVILHPAGGAAKPK